MKDLTVYFAQISAEGKDSKFIGLIKGPFIEIETAKGTLQYEAEKLKPFLKDGQEPVLKVRKKVIPVAEFNYRDKTFYIEEHVFTVGKYRILKQTRTARFQGVHAQEFGQIEYQNIKSHYNTEGCL